MTPESIPKSTSILVTLFSSSCEQILSSWFSFCPSTAWNWIWKKSKYAFMPVSQTSLFQHLEVWTWLILRYQSLRLLLIRCRTHLVSLSNLLMFNGDTYISVIDICFAFKSVAWFFLLLISFYWHNCLLLLLLAVSKKSVM